jgi:hypothetical protein
MFWQRITHVLCNMCSAFNFTITRKSFFLQKNYFVPLNFEVFLGQFLWNS